MVYFRQFYYDDDTKEFGVDECISSDDTRVTNRTAELQKQGRQVRCGTTGIYKIKKKVPSFEQCIKEGVQGYKYNPNLKW